MRGDSLQEADKRQDVIEPLQESDEVRRVVVFTSPKAGSGVGREQLPRLIELLGSAGIDTRVTDNAADLQDLALSNHGAGSPVVVAAGGDGTLALAADKVDRQIAMVPMPLGTENLLALHFGYTVDADDVLRTIRYGRPFRIDAGRANGRLFLIMVSCGFDAEVVRSLHLTRSGHIRRFSYAGPILRALRRYRFPKIHVELRESIGSDAQSTDPSTDRVAPSSGDAIDCRWAMVFNLPKYAAGLEIEPDAISDDGLLDLIAFRKGSIASGLRYLAGVKLGKHRRYLDVLRRQGKTFELAAEGVVPYQVDGDYGGHLPLRIETLPGRIHLRLPARHSSTLPS